MSVRAPGRAITGRVRLALLGVVVAIAAVLWLQFRDHLSADEIRGHLRAAGAWGAVVFLAAFALGQGLFSVSSHVFLVVAGLVWNAPVALSLSWVGTLLSGTVAFGFARFVARDWVNRRVDGTRFERYQRPLVERGIRTVVLLRFVFFTMAPVQWMLGASQVTYRDYLLGTMVGNIPAILLSVFTGAGIARLLGLS